jgi:hypothetical protein
MNTRKIYFRLAVAALVASVSSFAFVACSSDDSNNTPGPSSHDSGATDSTTSSGGDSSGSGSGSDTGAMDSNTIDVGSCVSDASTCNSCYNAMQAQQDPYNACSPYTANCIPFDKSRVPMHPMVP